MRQSLCELILKNLLFVKKIFFLNEYYYKKTEQKFKVFEFAIFLLHP